MADDDWDLVDDMLLFDDDEDPLADLDDDPLDDPDVDPLDVEIAVEEPEIVPAPTRPRPPPRKGLLRRIFGI